MDKINGRKKKTPTKGKLEILCLIRRNYKTICPAEIEDKKRRAWMKTILKIAE